ncbi:MAG: acyl-CoA thioesterase [Bacteroides sp.]|nr:acyl-CoA thioesterase [Bacteroidales bacterium]MBD5223107.1 acyl-CoA thioesterase [Bacteroidales bacterium]MBD5305749.1 acyl-CoA thioesterase [Bacteroides sp.]
MHPDNLPNFSSFKSAVPLQIRFNDIDILGHLNNTVYFSFYDTGKAWFFKSIFNGEINWRKVETVIANVDCAYVAPIYFGDEIEVRTRCMEIHEKSFRLQQIIIDRNGQLKSCAETVMVCFDPETKSSQPLPLHWRTALENSCK